MDISIVTGTYNRLPLLQAMIESARQSAGALRHEFIIVDGGSSDGTLEWLRDQADVRLIEHGELRGAVAAFNDGARAAQGDYVALLNDDIEVVGDTLMRAWQSLESIPHAGQIAFKNDVSDPMSPRAEFDTAFGYLYGQCCLTRRELGNAVGWWGDGYHTYAGDTELGMKLWQAGWMVIPIDGCAVRDHVHHDALRVKNNPIGDNEPGRHNDSRLFYERWNGAMPAPQNWKAAPIGRLSFKARHGRLRSLRFKIVTPGWKPRRGLIQALSAYGPAEQMDQTAAVTKLGPERFQEWAYNQVEIFRPDLLILQAQGPDNIQPDTVQAIRADFPATVVVNFNGDARWPVPPFLVEMAHVCHLSLIVSPALFDNYLAGGASNVAYWPISFEPIYGQAQRPANPNELSGHDIVFLGSHYTSSLPGVRDRYDAVHALLEAGDLNIGLYGHGWGETAKAAGATDDDHEANVAIYANARLGLSISHFHNLWGYSSDRLYMLTATGCPALLRRFAGMEEHGFVDGQTCIAWETVEELVDKARYYLKRADEREAIGQAGRTLTLTRHSWDNRVRSLLTLLEDRAI